LLWALRVSAVAAAAIQSTAAAVWVFVCVVRPPFEPLFTDKGAGATAPARSAVDFFFALFPVREHTDPAGFHNGGVIRLNGRRVVRGGSWNNTQGNARLGYRNHNDPDNRNNNLGFRVCRASHIFTRLLMVACVVCGRRAQGIARYPWASKNTTWSRLGVAAQSVKMARTGPVCTSMPRQAYIKPERCLGCTPAAPA
jgi:hypothetical protein